MTKPKSAEVGEGVAMVEEQRADKPVIVKALPGVDWAKVRQRPDRGMEVVFPRRSVDREADGVVERRLRWRWRWW